MQLVVSDLLPLLILFSFHTFAIKTQIIFKVTLLLYPFLYAVTLEEHFASELLELEVLGFDDVDENIQALLDTSGDINEAMQLLRRNGRFNLD